jgi:hypothetical protein
MAQDAVLPLLDSGLVLKPGEQFIGVYQNHPDKTNEAVVVTDTGLLIRSWGKWVRLNYDDMERVDIPEQKNKAENLHVFCKNRGQRIIVPIRGGRGRTRDVFTFLRFLIRTIEDRK